MPLWAWILVSVAAGGALGAIVWSVSLPRLTEIIRKTPGPELPERLAPGWHAQCNKCGRTRSLASVGGIRMGGNRNAEKVTIGWCRACRGLRVIRILHADWLRAPGSGTAHPNASQSGALHTSATASGEPTP